jgi:hypothetical protein
LMPMKGNLEAYPGMWNKSSMSCQQSQSEGGPSRKDPHKLLLVLRSR